MPIIVGIDGTGEQVLPGFGRNAKYDASFEKSHVKTICNDAGTKAQYNRGPLVLGGGLHAAVITGRSFIESERSRKGSSEPILLTGFSRGGLGVLLIARDLERKGIPVEAMLLFDAIDMYMFDSVEKVPSNVRNVWHARSDPAAHSRQNWRKKDCGGDPGNAQVNYTENFYRCTHGAMGGTPQHDDSKPDEYISEFGSGKTNVKYRDNPIISRRVLLEAQPFLRAHNFK